MAINSWNAKVNYKNISCAEMQPDDKKVLN